MGTKLNREYRKTEYMIVRLEKRLISWNNRLHRLKNLSPSTSGIPEIDELTFAILNAPVNNEVLMETPDKKALTKYSVSYILEDIVALEHPAYSGRETRQRNDVALCHAVSASFFPLHFVPPFSSFITANQA